MNASLIKRYEDEVNVPLIVNVDFYRMENGMKFECKVSFHHRSLTLHCLHFDFRKDKNHPTLFREQRQNKTQNRKPAYFSPSKWSQCY